MKGLSFSEPMVKAWLAGTKTVTRRLMNPQPEFYGSGCWYPDDLCWMRSKHYSDENHFKKGASLDFGRYKTGDLVYIKETWAVHADDEITNFQKGAMIFYKADHDSDPHINRWRSPMMMPEWAARSHARIISARPERVQEITEEEAKREGITPFRNDPEGDYWTDGKYRTAFEYLWNELHGWNPPSFQENPWVWRYELEKLP